MSEQIDHRQALMDETKEVPDEVPPNLLQSRRTALELQTEFAEWDRLSDEALTQFEKEIN